MIESTYSTVAELHDMNAQGWQVEQTSAAEMGQLHTC